MNIPYFDIARLNATYGDELYTAATHTMRSGRYVRGSEVEHFEHEYADYVGTQYCISTGNGLDALCAVLMAWKQIYGWDDADEVILPANTFIATALAVTRARLTPILCEPCIDRPTIDTTRITPLITPHTRAIIPVHLYGQMADMDAINRIARRHHLMVLEDACQAHGAIYNSCLDPGLASLFGRRAGNNADAAAFSFYPIKNLGCMGDGGAVTTNNRELADRVRAITNYGQTTHYSHTYQGFNSRLDEVQAAILRVKLPRLDRDNCRRVEIAHYYSTHICHPAVQLLPHVADKSHVYHIYPIRCKNRSRLQEILNTCGIGTLIHYPTPINRQQAYADSHFPAMPVAEAWADEELSLPINPALADEEVTQVVDAINQNIY